MRRLLLIVLLLLALPALAAEPWRQLGPDGGELTVVADQRVPGRLFASGWHMWMSEDSGTSWRLLDVEASLVAAATDPRDANVIWIAGEYRLSRSADGGRTFTTMYRGAIQGIGFAGNTLYVASENGLLSLGADGKMSITDPSTPVQLFATPALLYLVLNGGILWSADGNGFTGTGALGNKSILGVDGDRLWATDTYGYALSRSDDRGAHWTFVGMLGRKATPFVADPVKHRLFWPSQSGLRVSDDSGATWHDLAAAPGTDWLSMSSGASGLLATVDSRVIITRDGGATWQAVDHGLVDDDIRGLAVDPWTAGRLVATAQQDLVRYNVNGWDARFHSPEREVNSTAFDPLTPGRAVAISRGDGCACLQESRDGGATWTRKGEVGDGVSIVNEARFVFDPWRPSRLYFLEHWLDASVSDDGGATWSALDFGCGGRVMDIAVTESALYAATGCGVFRSLDHGTAWTAAAPVAAGAPCEIGSGAEAIAAAHGVVIVASAYSAECVAQIWASSDGGNTWQHPFSKPNADGYFGAYSVVADPRRAGRFFVATLTGVYRTDDAGVSWQPAGLPAAAGISLVVAFDASVGRLYAGTTAGVWVLDVGDPPPRRRAAR